MGDSELDFADHGSEGLGVGSQDRSIATDFSSISSGFRPRVKRSAASVLMMGKTKRQRRKEQLESSQSSRDSGSVVSSYQDSSSSKKNKLRLPSTSSQHGAKQTRKKPLSSKLSKIPENEKTSSSISRRTMSCRSDHFSVKDIAQSQMRLDECLFLCESVVSQRNPLEPLESLAEILSNRENRRHLFLSSQGNHVLQSVVNVFAWVNQFIEKDGTDISTKLPASPVAYCETQSTTSSSLIHDLPDDRQPILNAAKIVAYFVSLDCTLCTEASHATKNNQGVAASARRIRHAILSNPECMQGLFQLVLDDPLTEHLRHSNKRGGTAQATQGNETLRNNDGSPDAASRIGKTDPTVQGRLKRRQLKLERSTSCSRDTTPEGKSESLSFASSLSAPSVKKNLLFQTGPQIVVWAETILKSGEMVAIGKTSVDAVPDVKSTSMSWNMSDGSFQHTCKNEFRSYLCSSIAPLLAVKRIISAKHEKYEESAIDDDQGIDGGSLDVNEDYNPIVATNQMISSSGVLPLLSRALADSLLAAIAQIKCSSGGCEGCVKSLSTRVCSLASMADAASLFNVRNRKELCNEGFTSETNGYLVVGMISFLRVLLGKSIVLEGVWGETALSLLKTLTSLSHENEVVANELKSKLFDEQVDPKCTEKTQRTCLSVLVSFLQECVVQKQGKDRDSKLLYDCQIYCLSIMANIASSQGCVEVLIKMNISQIDGTGNMLCLVWLTRWLVSLTESFHTAIVESSFGKISSKHEDRILTLREEEGLVASGKGFIFLSSIIVQGCCAETITSIFNEIPGSSSHEKMTLIRNTLKAFMSFYRQSVGGLSVAITAPLQILLKKLDAFEVPKYL